MNINPRTQNQPGTVPGIIYGPAIKNNINVYINSSDAETLEKNPKLFSTVFEFKRKKVIVKDIQRHKISNSISHIDFMHVESRKPFITKLPIKFVNVMQNSIISLGGMLQVTRFFIDVKIAALDKMPEFILVDVASMKKNTITAQDLTLPKGINLTTKSQYLTIASVIKASGAKK